MKKSTLESMRNYLNGDTTVNVETLREEVNAEYDRVTAKSRANSEMYAEAWDALDATEEWNRPMMAKELWPLVENAVPEGFTLSKMQYGLREKWQDKVQRHDNGKDAYMYSRR